MAHTASNPIRAYFVINFDLSAKKRLQSVVLRYFMQTSRVNGLTSGVFAFLIPASCLNQKGSDTRRDNTTFPFGDCSPPCRARLPTSQAATVCVTDLRWPPWAETTSPAAFSSSIPFCRMLSAALMSRSCSIPHSGHRQMRL